MKAGMDMMMFTLSDMLILAAMKPRTGKPPATAPVQRRSAQLAGAGGFIKL